MATGTAFYNLTKPASTENYNLAVWNTNLDMIDAQMHQNETETFTGATELADGVVGNVPAPLIADKDKFLKGDGTWATPSGGGGGSSAEEMTLAEYNELTTAEKNDGTIRFIPAGSGGAYPSQIKYMSKTYADASGGGGGGSATVDTLYTNPSTTAPASISLSASIFDYDLIIMRAHRTLSNMETFKADGVYLTLGLSIGDSIAVCDDTQYAWYTISANDTLTQYAANMVVEYVYGIKF